MQYEEQQVAYDLKTIRQLRKVLIEARECILLLSNGRGHEALLAAIAETLDEE